MHLYRKQYFFSLSKFYVKTDGTLTQINIFVCWKPTLKLFIRFLKKNLRLICSFFHSRFIGYHSLVENWFKTKYMPLHVSIYLTFITNAVYFFSFSVKVTVAIYRFDGTSAHAWIDSHGKVDIAVA